jgi:phosphatidylglycerol:prolipoprotein diacylglycerol transferase
MYPHSLFLGLTLYDICIAVGIIACFAAYRICADRFELRAKLQNFTLLTAFIAIIAGYGSAVLVQAIYNIKDVGRFEITSGTGATFLGGLVGGALAFILVYFIVGHFVFPGGYNRSSFIKTADCAACSITVAHAFGRIGCLMAGCCYGNVTDAWYGIYMRSVGAKVVPVQLFEALFLFALFASLMILTFRFGRYVMPSYMIAYGIWRFFIEYARADERGDTLVSFLSPSQLVAILLIIGGILLFAIELKIHKEKREEGATKDEA